MFMNSEDMSTDDEIDTNLSLSVRLQTKKTDYNGTRSKNISKECKQQSNFRKKAQTKQNALKSIVSSSPESNFYDQAFIPETPSPYSNKKRQNGDKNEQLAKPKRTCLSDRFLPSEWSRSKKKNGLTENHMCNSGKKFFKYGPAGGKKRKNCCDSIEQDLLPDKKYDSFAFSSDASSSCASSSTFNNQKQKFKTTEDVCNGVESESNVASCCDAPKSEFSQIYENLCQPSTSKAVNEFSFSNGHHSSERPQPYPRGVQFIDSDSEKESQSLFSNIALKGGRPPSDTTGAAEEDISNTLRQMLRYSDDSDDDWQANYRIRPKNVWLSDSDSSDIRVSTHKVLGSFKKLSSTESNDSSLDSSSTSPDERSCFGASADSAKVKNESNCSFASNVRNDGKNSADNCTSTRQSSVRSSMHHRHRLSRHESSCRRSGSPHPRAVRGRRQARMSRTSVGQLGSTFRSNRIDLASRFPDLFDAEDSSDVEFFTANSYSDPETSTESVGGTNVSSTVANNSNYRSSQNHACDRSVVIGGSSEDEISVIYSSNSSYSDTGNRRRQHRGTGRRQRNRGPSRNTHVGSQEIVSLSPDPVEQVRQMEEDERYARMLQAQFDAELNEQECLVPHDVTDSDDSTDENEIIDPVADFEIPADEQRSRIRNSSQQQSVIDTSPFRFSAQVRGRARMRASSNVIVFSGGRRRQFRRRLISFQSDPWMFHFARILGLGSSDQDHEPTDYDALIELAETVGEAVPRGLHKDEINRLPTRKFSCPSRGASTSACEIIHKRTELNKECQVCLCDYENGDVLRILPCFHEFHTPCIDPWLKINHTCPVCRVEVYLGN